VRDSPALLALAWILWCTLHSALAAPRVRDAAARFAGGGARLLYNLIALVTLAPLVWLTLRFRGPVVFDWWGAALPVGVALAGAAGLLFAAAARNYDLSAFLGLRQLRTGEHPAALGVGEPLRRDGVHRLVRHPWYLGSLLVLWAPTRDAAGLAASTVLSVYLVVGAMLEERKLVAAYGDAYRRYRDEVPMLFPRLRRRGGGA
jgi:protein-S-isoprenylcysteine O-methyltransferase Ste14